MDNPLFVNERKSTGDLSRPSTHFSKDSRVSGFCWSCFWLIEDLTPQASFALFHYQDHSCGACFLEKGCAVKLNNVRMLQFSDEQNQKHAICIKGMQNWLYFNKLSETFLSYLSILSTEYSHVREMKLRISQYGLKNRRTNKKLKWYIRRKQLRFAPQRTPLDTKFREEFRKGRVHFFSK